MMIEDKLDSICLSSFRGEDFCKRLQKFTKNW